MGLEVVEEPDDVGEIDPAVAVVVERLERLVVGDSAEVVADLKGLVTTKNHLDFSRGMSSVMVDILPVLSYLLAITETAFHLVWIAVRVAAIYWPRRY